MNLSKHAHAQAFKCLQTYDVINDITNFKDKLLRP